ncbi:syndecan-1 [Pyxicephalus adspersus]|uniref:syndecan-1 n=1 Tax=Pyxicephalus adspersus TaxID=30357 RepID=UPI003B5BB579
MDLLALLFVLGICSSLASGNDVKSAPPEDLDSSGDDEDFSGSGIDMFFENSEEEDDVFSTPISYLVPAVTQFSTIQPDIAIEEETKEENVTQPMQTTLPYDPIEDIFEIDPVGKDPLAEVASTLEPTTHQTSTVESVDDEKKHHHHPHHHHHHHTTIPATSPTDKLDVVEETTSGPVEVEKPFVFPEVQETTTSTPDEGDVDDLVQEVTQTPEDSNQHVDHPETTSGLTSAPYAENEETTADPADVGQIPDFVESVEKTTVADETHTHKQQHHHHPHHHTTTVVPLNGSDILIEDTEKPNYLEPEEDLNQQAEVTTTPSSEDKHHDHKHHHKHHHTTTPEATQSTVPEQFIVDSKGRRIHVPPAETTTAFSLDDEEPVGSTVHSNNSISDEDTQDVTEEESGNGPEKDSDMFFSATESIVKSDRMAPDSSEGSAGASHGIMERKELLAGIIAGGIAGLVFAASLVVFVFYRMKKKDEGSYSLEEPKQSNGGYQKPREQREFYA